jgi:hypothetical protein
MAKNNYQTYTESTPFGTYRADLIRRGAMCTAMAPRHPELAAVAAAAKTLVAEIDSRREALQDAEDAQVIANAIEDAEKIDVLEVYTELRRTMFAKTGDVATLLPDAPSTLARLGIDNFTKRAEIAIANLKALPATDPIRVAFLANLEKEVAEFVTADKAEDQKRDELKTIRVALTLYKSELAQAREVQLGTILTVLKDRDKVAMFTIPWRKASRPTADETESKEPTTP